MGEVYRARDTRLDRDVALKVLRERLAADADARARFEREAKAVASLSHPNILAIYDFGVAGEVPFSVTELLEGETLRARLAAGPLPWRTAVEIAAAIADGLTSAHARGIVHRDVKPENVFLTRDDRVKLLDFGLARTTTVRSAAQPATRRPPSRPQRLVMGTMGYMAPEQARGDAVRPRPTSLRLAACCYEMVTGQRAFESDTPAETLAAILHAPRRPCPSSRGAAGAHRAPSSTAWRSRRRADSGRPRPRVALRTMLLDSGVDTPAAERRGAKTAGAQHSVAVLPFYHAPATPATSTSSARASPRTSSTASPGVRGLRVVPRIAGLPPCRARG